MNVFEQKLMESSEAKLTGYLHETSAEMPQRTLRPAMLVLPGGGYEFCSDREAEPIALAWFCRGYNAFVLRYSVLDPVQKTPLYLQPLREAACAVATLREKAQDWNLDAHRIAVIGFSAGGHLAASLGVHWGSARLNSPLDFQGENRPDAMILGYPVISTRQEAGEGWQYSSQRLTALQPDWLDYFALEEQVKTDTTPAFLWSTTTDTCVNCDHSLRFVRALNAAGVPNELHIFGAGNHGYSLANEETGNPAVPADGHVAQWMPLAAQWLNSRFDWKE